MQDNLNVCNSKEQRKGIKIWNNLATSYSKLGSSIQAFATPYPSHIPL